MMLIPKAEEQLHKVVALVTSAGSCSPSASPCMADFDYDDSRQAAVRRRQAVDRGHQRRYIVGIDGLSLPLIAAHAADLAAVHHLPLEPLPRAAQPEGVPHPHPGARDGMLGTFVAQDLILFFVFFEVVLLPMYFMIGVWGGEQRQYASIKFFLFTLFGSALMIVSFLALYFVAGGDDVLDGRRSPMASPSRRGRRPRAIAPRC